MYYDHKKERVLLKDGTSIITPFAFARRRLSGKEMDNVAVIDTYDSQQYDLLYQANTSTDINDSEPEPEDHIHSEEDLNTLYRIISNSTRFEDTPEALERIEEEMAWYEKTNNVTFLLKCFELVSRFKKDGVIWGVGRGSSCASYILFLLEIHDIDSIKYDIPFNELSKEVDDG